MDSMQTLFRAALIVAACVPLSAPAQGDDSPENAAERTERVLLDARRRF
jgi:hypothetical protein